MQLIENNSCPVEDRTELIAMEKIVLDLLRLQGVQAKALIERFRRLKEILIPHK
jgi:hypothetical protein